MLKGLAPLVSPQTRLLILGSFPGVVSLQTQRYYGHPQNHFWPVLEAIYSCSPTKTGASSYEIRSNWLLSKGLGVWDVYASCTREGSLDSQIRGAVLNDFSSLMLQCPNLQAVAHNGGESFRHSKRVEESMQGCAVQREGNSNVTSNVNSNVNSRAPQFYKLPSTSRANASWSFERKLAAWREVFEKHGLID